MRLAEMIKSMHPTSGRSSWIKGVRWPLIEVLTTMESGTSPIFVRATSGSARMATARSLSTVRTAARGSPSYFSFGRSSPSTFVIDLTHLSGRIGTRIPRVRLDNATGAMSSKTSCSETPATLRELADAAAVDVKERSGAETVRRADAVDDSVRRGKVAVDEPKSPPPKWPSTRRCRCAYLLRRVP